MPGWAWIEVRSFYVHAWAGLSEVSTLADGRLGPDLRQIPTS